MKNNKSRLPRLRWEAIEPELQTVVKDSGNPVTRDAVFAKLYWFLIREATIAFRGFGRRDAEERAFDAVHNWWAASSTFAKRCRADTPLFPYARAALRYIVIGMAVGGKQGTVDIDDVELSGSDPELVSRTEQDELWETVRCAIKRLPERYRRVIELRYETGLSTSEIAAALSVPTNTIRVWNFRASKLLRDDLKGVAS